MCIIVLCRVIKMFNRFVFDYPPRNKIYRAKFVNFNLLLVSVILCCVCKISISSTPEKTDDGVTVVTIDQGRLAGALFTSGNGTKYHGYLGIPFAKPPIGELRFEPPQPPESWQGIKDATKHPSMCLQNYPFGNEVIGSEDCLYLNVFTPEKKSTLLPVMVYIHGGALTTEGASSYIPAYLMDRSVIVVVIQYRLGILGFLSTGDEVVPGNTAMKDQVAALKWVQKNIVHFGGDSSTVTIFGHSAGSACVHLHLYSHLSKGLFHRAISQSGTGMSFWATLPPSLARQRALALGVLNGCSTKSTEAMVRCLKSVPALDMLFAQQKFNIWKKELTIAFPIVAEQKSVEDAFLTEYPWRTEVVNKVPWIAGVTSGEGFMLAKKFLVDGNQLVKDLNSQYWRAFPILFHYNNWLQDDEVKMRQVTDAVKNYYFKDQDIGSNTSNALVNLFTDCLFFFSSAEATYRYEESVYFYYYDHINKESYRSVMDGSIKLDTYPGPSHGEELSNHFRRFNYPLKGEDLEVSKRLTSYWINFAYFGNPNGDDTGSTWDPVKSKDDLEYLHITTKEDTMKISLLVERYALWKGLQILPIEEVKNKDEL